MWLTESQIQLIVEALIPPELQSALDAEGITHLVDRHDSMYLAHKNTQFPDTPGQHQWRITPLVKGHGGGTDNATAPTHYSFKEPSVLASYMRKIKDAPEEWDEYSIHQMVSSKNGPSGRRDGFGDKLYRGPSDKNPAQKELPFGESTIYERAVSQIVDDILEEVQGQESMVVADGFYNSRILPHMGIHRRNKIATVMAGAVGNTPS